MGVGSLCWQGGLHYTITLSTIFFIFLSSPLPSIQCSLFIIVSKVSGKTRFFLSPLPTNVKNGQVESLGCLLSCGYLRSGLCSSQYVKIGSVMWMEQNPGPANQRQRYSSAFVKYLKTITSSICERYHLGWSCEDRTRIRSRRCCCLN